MLVGAAPACRFSLKPRRAGRFSARTFSLSLPEKTRSTLWRSRAGSPKGKSLPDRIRSTP
ncbi:MAG: hypothetical protein K6T29_00245 [Peptococcaceae bacterium]|nr:hypothetical protein [Peptococcaceae bacterium]